MKKRKICVVSGTRAEYGLLRWVMEEIRDSPVLELQVIATGMHLSPEFGLTYKEIEADGFSIDGKVEMLLSADTPSAISKSLGLALIGFSDTYAQLQPDFVLVLGDRYEIFGATLAATFARIPIAHLHGGETSEGAYDEAIRHSITKMSHIHFTATEEYRQRIVQLGENPEQVFLVGGLGVDAIHKLKLLNKDELERSLDFKLGIKNLLVTFHPATLEDNTSEEQINEVFAALKNIEDTHIIFTMPNADTNGRIIWGLINDFVKGNRNCKAFISLGQLHYLSCIQHFDGILGNSSSGLTEVPSFKKGTINIGDRQRGRMKADSIIDCAPIKHSILKAIEQLYSVEFQERLVGSKNPYGTGGASNAIVEVLEGLSISNILKKTFFDIR